MPDLKFTFAAVKGEFAAAMKEAYQPIAVAGSGAIRDMAADIKLDGRANIAAAGFSKRWQNAFRVDTYPKRGVSAGAAALVFHRIPYADVFETGATIRGKPTLWIPLPSTPKKIGGKKMTPKLYIQSIGPLIYLKRGKHPLLLGKTDALTPRGNKTARVSLASLRRGGAGASSTRAVPLFYGIDVVDIRARFKLRSITDGRAAQLPAYYVKNFDPGN